ncbi:SNF2 family N-terminal domain-containing protein [Dichotomocladium elegans]|nr:SNF2 family N-terminal domain-containing protein [Dichotomocladium elegans]
MNTGGMPFEFEHNKTTATHERYSPETSSKLTAATPATAPDSSKRRRLVPIHDYSRPPFSMPARLSRQIQQHEQQQQQQQQQQRKLTENICLGMIKTDIVTAKVLDLVKDESFEAVNLICEGKRDQVNYTFTVSSRGTPRKFYGWVPFEDTRVLGPFAEHRLIWWDAVIPRDKANHARTPLYIILYCQLCHSDIVSKSIEDNRLTLRDPPFYNPTCKYQNPHMRSTIDKSGELQEQIRKDIIQLLDNVPNGRLSDDADNDHANMSPNADDRPYTVEGLQVPLLPHQRRGVEWMRERENASSCPGGILADMGLGKTIQTIALMVSTMSETNERRTTLIVTPLALIQQWANEIQSKVKARKLNVLVYHGPSRAKDPVVFSQYDVVVTTYQVVAADFPNTVKRSRRRNNGDEGSNNGSRSQTPENGASPETSRSPSPPSTETYGPLFQVAWYRVVLDEAQQIKNKNTRSATSCTALRAKKRWCLTGTPMQNHVEELYSLFRFLRVEPLNDYHTFKKTISGPIQAGDGSLALERLKVVLMAVMLRRTKQILRQATLSDTDAPRTPPSDAPSPGLLSQRLSLQLPAREKKDIILDFNEHERALYELLSIKTRSAVKMLIMADKGERNYLNMLCMLLRLRQACNHPQLVLKSMRADKDAFDLATRFSANGSGGVGAVCELCGEPSVQTDTPFCSSCRTQVEHLTGPAMTTSTKIKTMLEVLEDTRRRFPSEKTIIFSQFTSMLDLMEDPLKRAGFKYCRYDGSMTNQLREKSLDTLRTDPECSVMLISLKCGSLGLNLTAANHVILMDIWWNPAVEEQAIDRVHRIGQRLPVRVVRLVIDRTIEQKIILLQKRKAQMVQGALGDGIIKDTKLTMKEIRALFDLE